MNYTKGPWEVGLVGGPYKVIRDWDGAPVTQPHLLTGPKFEVCYKDAIEAELEAERLNLVFEAGRFSVTGQGQEERDFNFKDALDSALFELLDKCRENCNHGCHTGNDDTYWDECPDHKFMTDEIDKLRKTNWPEVQAHYSKMADELASADKAQDGKGGA